MSHRVEAAIEDIEIVFSIAGRTRLSVPWIEGDARLASQIVAELEAIPAIFDVKASTLTARILILHDEMVSAEDVRQLLPVPDIFKKNDHATTADWVTSVGVGAVGIVGLASLTASPIWLTAAGIASLVWTAQLVRQQIEDAFQTEPGNDEDGNFLMQLTGELSSHRSDLSVAALCGAGAVALSLARFGVVALSINKATLGLVGGGSAGALVFVHYGLLTMGLTALQSALEYAGQRRWRKASQDMQRRLKIQCYARIQGAPLEYVDKKGSGELVATLTSDINAIEDFFEAGWEGYQIVINGAAIFAIFFTTVPVMGWLSCMGVPFVLWSMTSLQKKAVPRYEKVRASAGTLATAVETNLNRLETIKSFVAEKDQTDRISVMAEEGWQAGIDTSKVSSAFVPALEFSVITGISLAMAGGGVVTGSTMSIGAYSTSIMMNRQLLWPITQFGRLMSTANRSTASLRRIFRHLYGPVERLERGEQLRLAAIAGDLRYDEITFGYEEGRPVFDGLSIDIPAGQTTAIVGPTGAGKSSLVRLLLRFNMPETGDVLFDGKPVTSLQLKDLRGAIAVVSQDTSLLTMSVKDNISLGAARDQPLENIVRAAKLACAHDFIQRLPSGYETILEAGGKLLSGGERQRVAIARAILKDAPVLVLDEATSSLDGKTEAEVFANLSECYAQRTVMMIAHRLSSVMHADQVYVLDRSGICEYGKPSELLASKGMFEALWRIQSRAAG